MKSPHGLYTFQRIANRQDWPHWTKSGLLPQDAPTILGENPWKSSDSLLQEKMNPEEAAPNEIMQKALLVRPQIFSEYQKQSGETLQKLNIQSKERPWQRAGLDGISKNRWHIVEIKAGESAYQKAAELQRVPPLYYAEGQHILSITGLPYMTYHFHTGRSDQKPLSFPLRRNNKYIERLVEKEREFFQTLQNQKLNPSKTLIETVQRAILKTGPKVEYHTYQQIVPALLTPLGEPTPKGLTLLQKA